MILNTTKMHDITHTIPYTSDRFAASMNGNIYEWDGRDQKWSKLDPNSDGNYYIKLRSDDNDRDLHPVTMSASRLVYSAFFRVHPSSVVIKEFGWNQEGNNPHPQLQNLINLLSKEKPVKNTDAVKLARNQVFKANNNLCEVYRSLERFETQIKGLTNTVEDYRKQVSQIKLNSSIDENIYKELLTSLKHGLDNMKDESFYKPLVHKAIDAMKVYDPNASFHNYPYRVLLEDLPQYTVTKDGDVYHKSEKLLVVEDKWHRKCVDVSNDSACNCTVITRVPIDVIMMNAFRKKDLPSFYTEQLVYHIDCDESNNSIDNLCLEQDVDNALESAQAAKDDYEIAKWLRCKYHNLSRRLEQLETMHTSCETEATSAYGILVNNVKHYIKCEEAFYIANHQNDEVDA